MVEPPICKICSSNWIIFPIFRVKVENVGNHHLAFIFFCSRHISKLNANFKDLKDPFRSWWKTEWGNLPNRDLRAQNKEANLEGERMGGRVTGKMSSSNKMKKEGLVFKPKWKWNKEKCLFISEDLRLTKDLTSSCVFTSLHPRLSLGTWPASQSNFEAPWVSHAHVSRCKSQTLLNKGCKK